MKNETKVVAAKTVAAKVVADSIHKGNRVISIEATSPKFLDAEIEKHRMLNTNSSSSRAIPVSKIADQIRHNPYLPADVRYREAGMQGHSKLNEADLRIFHNDLNELASYLADLAFEWSGSDNIHKQHVNRYLEPFTIQCKIISGNIESFEHMLKLRLADAADPNVQEWARAIEAAIFSSQPKQLNVGEWHLPYVTAGDMQKYSLQQCKSMSVAKCAAISYYRHEADKTMGEYLKLAVTLAKSGHWSCFDHQLTPALDSFQRGITALDIHNNLLSGSYKNWVCYRNVLTSKTRNHSDIYLISVLISIYYTLISI